MDYATRHLIRDQALQIAEQIPDEKGFVTTTFYKDDEVIRGDTTGLITLTTVLLLHATSSDDAKTLEQRLCGMLPRHRYIGVRIISDESEIESLREEGKASI